MHFEVTRADGHLEPAAVAAGLLECLGDLRLAEAEEAERPPQRRPASGKHPPDGLRLERVRPEPLQLDRGARQDHDGRPVRLDDEPRRRAREPERDRALRERRLLAHASSEVGVRSLHPLGHAPRDALDLRLQPLVDAELQAGDLREDLHRTVVVGRPEPAGGHDEVGRGDRLPERRLQLARVVADDLDPGGLEPQCEQ